MINSVKEGKMRRFWVENDLILTKGRRIYVPSYDNLRREVIKESHDSKWMGHPSINCTLTLVRDSHYWPHLKDEVGECFYGLHPGLK